MEVVARIFTLVGLLLLFSGGRAPHALYLSVIDISHSIDTQYTQITVKVFTDDLQNAIRNFSKSYSHQPEEQFIESNKQLILNYFAKNLMIHINNESKTLKLQKFKKENDAHFIFFQIPSPLTWSNFQIKAGYFTEIFPDQSNILTLKYGKESYYSRLNKSNSTFETNFH